MEEMEYPIRINRYLAKKGIATRREADTLIALGKVKLNGRVAILGDIVKKEDMVEVAKQLRPQPHSYIAYYKPRGIITHSPQGDEKDIQGIRKTKALFPVGRLDKDSEGLIILTDDGRITDRLLNPDYEHEREYVVDVDLPLKESTKDKLERGVLIEGYKTKKSKVKTLGARAFSITLREGKKHQIRRMCAALGFNVKNLKRVRIMNVSLQNLKPNESRTLQGEELRVFLSSLALA